MNVLFEYGIFFVEKFFNALCKRKYIQKAENIYGQCIDCWISKSQ